MKFGMKTAEGVTLQTVAIFCKKLRNLLRGVEWEGSSRWVSIEKLYESEELSESALAHPEVAWGIDETVLRNRIRDVLDPLREAVDTLNEKVMKSKLKSFEEPPEIGADQLQRLQAKEEALSATAGEALELVQRVKSMLKDSIESQDEDALIAATN